MERFLDLVKQRQSDRRYDPEKTVEPEKLARIIEAARLAPSACNAQPWHFVVVDDPDLKNRVADAAANRVLGMNHFTKQAPVLGGWIKRKHFPRIDIGIVAAHIVLAAADEGLGSCIVGWFDEAAVRKVLAIPSGKRVLLDIVIGYSADPLREKSRRSVCEVASRNQYDMPYGE